MAEITANAYRLEPKDMLCVVLEATGLGRPVCETIADAPRIAGVRCWVSAFVLMAGEWLSGV